MDVPVSDLTVHGHDAHFGVNVLGHFYLTQLLLPTLLNSTTPETPVRVVNTAGSAHLLSKATCSGGPVQLSTLTDGPERRKMTPVSLHAQSKSVCVDSTQTCRYEECLMLLAPRRAMSYFRMNLQRDTGPAGSFPCHSVQV